MAKVITHEKFIKDVNILYKKIVAEVLNKSFKKERDNQNPRT